MGLKRIWYHPNGKISVTHGDLTQNPEMTKKLKLRFPDSEFEDVDESVIPPRDGNRDRWRGTKATGIQIDNAVVLRQDLEKDIDDELALPNPDMKKVMVLRRKLDKREYD